MPPAELEALLLTTTRIADAAVIGVKDADGEEIPKAFVVKQPGAEISEDDVMSFVAERIAPHKKVRVVEFIDEIPKSGSGKILARTSAPAKPPPEGLPDDQRRTHRPSRTAAPAPARAARPGRPVPTSERPRTASL